MIQKMAEYEDRALRLTALELTNPESSAENRIEDATSFYEFISGLPLCDTDCKGQDIACVPDLAQREARERGEQ